MNRHTLAAKKMRDALLDKLGAWCVDCGEDDRDLLEFDHIHGRAWTPSKFSFRQRMMIYTRETAEGKIRVLCGECNLKRRKRNDSGLCVPTASAVPVTDNMPF